MIAENITTEELEYCYATLEKLRSEGITWATEAAVHMAFLLVGRKKLQQIKEREEEAERKQQEKEKNRREQKQLHVDRGLVAGLDLSDRCIERADTILTEAYHKDGGVTWGTQSAAVYLASILCAERRTQAEVAAHLRVSITTVRKHYKWLCQLQLDSLSLRLEGGESA